MRKSLASRADFNALTLSNGLRIVGRANRNCVNVAQAIELDPEEPHRVIVVVAKFPFPVHLYRCVYVSLAKQIFICDLNNSCRQIRF